MLVVPENFFHELNQVNWMLVIRLMLWSCKHTNLAKILDQSKVVNFKCFSVKSITWFWGKFLKPMFSRIRKIMNFLILNLYNH